jgi:hypothetical protein
MRFPCSFCIYDLSRGMVAYSFGEGKTIERLDIDPSQGRVTLES